jgi:hypothetical protein
MVTKSLARREQELDDRKWSASLAYVRLYNAWQLAMKAYGVWSPIERQAFEELETARKRYNRLAKAIVR